MKRQIGPAAVGALALAFTYLFFFEYLPPLKRVHIPYDLRDYHYPLMNYAFLALQEGRFPLWDPTNYCGLSFLGNVQAGLFYPPNWLLFAANLRSPRLLFQSLEILVILHVWLAFFLCYIWLRKKGLAQLPSTLDAGVFAYTWRLTPSPAPGAGRQLWETAWPWPRPCWS